MFGSAVIGSGVVELMCGMAVTGVVDAQAEHGTPAIGITVQEDTDGIAAVGGKK
jgi:hypothetical protein